MQQRPTPRQAPRESLTLQDIYRVLFRHKWKILVVWSVGFAITGYLWHTHLTKYQSEAQLMVRYVLDNRAVGPVVGNSEIQRVDQGSQGIVNGELAILNSFDLALNVAKAVGPEKILVKYGGGNDLNTAAIMLHNDFTVDAPNRGTVLELAIKHPDRDLVCSILNQYIESYRTKHKEIHEAAGIQYEFLTQQKDKLWAELSQTEEELRKTKVRAGITSLEDAKRFSLDQVARCEKDLSNAEAELAEQKALLREPLIPNSDKPTNSIASTPPPVEKVAEYRRVCLLIDNLEKREQELLLQFTPESQTVRDIRSSLVENMKAKSLLETKYPTLIQSKVSIVVDPSISGPGTAISRAELASDKARSLQARINVVSRQLKEAKDQLASIDAVEASITELQRRKELQEQNYRSVYASLEKVRIDESLSSGRVSNIETIQTPSPPYADLKKFFKKLAMVFFGAFAAGPALAFAIELYLDRSFKKPSEIERKLGIPVFLSIPRTTDSASSSAKLLTWTNGQDNSTQPQLIDQLPADHSRPLQPFFESLRDRMLMSFELRNLMHNPKLVAITSAGKGAGVSTVAVGLAASLSKTGEGNVLLVNMNTVGEGATHTFHKGKLECGLVDALESEKRASAQVSENLFVVSEAPEPGANTSLPRVVHKRIFALLPKLRASDYDYIIFDLPPVGELTPTSKLARYMDSVLMVVESEKSDRDGVQHATDLLKQFEVQHLGVVLNKTQEYVPKILRGNES